MTPFSAARDGVRGGRPYPRRLSAHRGERHEAVQCGGRLCPWVQRGILWIGREVGLLKPNQNRSRLAAPVLITALLLLYYAGFFILLAVMPALSLWSRLLLGVAPLALMGVSVFVLVERIREVRSGEEDDLDRY